MPKLSVLIPSRQEKYLYPTIRDCFAKMRGETEVTVCLDGYWPEDWKSMTDAYPNLHTVHHGEPRGLRPAINSAAGSAISRGAKYLFKLDAHCLLDEGFDVKLLEQIEPNWIVVPRRKRLDPDVWAITETNKIDIDYHYLSFPDDPNDWGGKGLNGKVWEQRARERRDNPEYDLDSEMSSQGSAWLMASSYFQELELMDADSYGPFWNEAQELFLKCWLSGGRGVINKKTFYAHLHKGTRHGRGYKLPESWLQQGATFTKRWMFNEAWPKQTLPFKWLIEHFWPVPSWPDNWEEVLYATRKPRVITAGSSATTTDSVRVLPAGDVDVGGVGDSGNSSSLIIHKAHYGIGSLEDIDVREQLQSLVQNDSLDIIVNNSTLTPGQNPFRGKKKQLNVTYSIDKGEVVTRTVEEKDWLIIGPVQTKGGKSWQEGGPDGVKMTIEPEGLATATLSGEDFDAKAHVAEVIERMKDDPLMAGSIAKTAAAMNDYLIRRFSVSPQRLRGPMPIELRDFHRNDLAQLFAELGFKHGAEIGVAEGKFSEVILKASPEMHLLLVDPWHMYSGNPQNKSKEKHEFAFRETERRIAGYKNVEIMTKYSMDAVRHVDDESLDMCYLDACHSYPFIMEDLINWTRKVRSGGIVAIDDAFKLDEKRWGAGPMEAIYDYTRAMRINPWWLIAAHKSVDAFFVKP